MTRRHRALACVCALLASMQAHAAVLDLPPVQPRSSTPQETLRLRRELVLRDTEVTVQVTPDRNLAPRAAVDIRRLIAEGALLSYATELGMQGVPDLAGLETTVDLDLRLSIRNRLALDWTSPSKRWRSRVFSSSEDALGINERGTASSMGGGFDSSYGGRTGTYSFAYRTETRFEDRVAQQEYHSAGLGWSYALREAPVTVDLRPAVAATATPGIEASTLFMPRYEAGLTFQLDPGTRLRAGSRGQQELDHLGILNSQSQFLFTNFDWSMPGRARLQLETQVGTRSSFSPGGSAARVDEAQVRASPILPLGSTLSARMDMLLRAEREPTRLWSPVEQSVYFSLAGRW